MHLSLKQLRFGAVIISLMLLSGWIGFRLGQNGPGLVSFSATVSRNQPVSKQNLDLGLFWQVWDKLYQSYLIKGDLKPEQMIYGAIKGMTAALGDPYTVFLPPQANKESK